VAVPEALVDEKDGIRISFAPEVVDHAARCGVNLYRPGPMMVGEARGAPPLAMALLGQVRRAKALGRVPDEAPAFTVFYDSGGGTGLPTRGEVPRSEEVKVRLQELEAGRWALSALLNPDHPRGGGRRMLQNTPQASRRFRA
jgi:hypothetical protein